MNDTSEVWLRIYLELIRIGGVTMSQAAELADKGYAAYLERWKK